MIEWANTRLAVLTSAAMVCAALWPWPVSAEPLAELLPAFLKDSPKIRAADNDVAAARERTSVAIGAYYPELKVVGAAGHERINKPNDGDSHRAARQLDVTFTQLLYDFGKTGSAIDIAKMTEAQAEANLDIARQNAILEAATAYVNLYKASESLTYSKQSEANIRRQTGLEETKVQRGGGYSTDVLQAKRELAAAEARRIASELALVQGVNRFRAMFRREPGNLSTFNRPAVPNDRLPEKLDHALDVAQEHNPTLKSTYLATLIARSQVTNAFATGFAPKVEAIVERKHKHDVSGVIGYRQESKAIGQFTWPFNLGLTAVNSLKAAEFTSDASEQRLLDSRELVGEQVRNAWQELISSRQTADMRHNQTNLAGEFLDLARKERQLGQRSLLDVLTGETSYINAVSDALSADADVVVAALKLLVGMGRLEIGAVEKVADAAPPPALPGLPPAAKK